MNFIVIVLLFISCIVGACSSIEHECLGGMIGSAIGAGFALMAGFNAIIALSHAS